MASVQFAVTAVQYVSQSVAIEPLEELVLVLVLEEEDVDVLEEEDEELPPVVSPVSSPQAARPKAPQTATKPTNIKPLNVFIKSQSPLQASMRQNAALPVNSYLVSAHRFSMCLL